MTWLVTAGASIAVVEAVLWLPFAVRFRRLWSCYSKALKTIGSRRISDHWKEKVLVAYAARILVDSLALLIFLVLALIPLALAVLVGRYFGLDVYGVIVSVEGIAAMCMFSMVYVLVRQKARGRL